MQHCPHYRQQPAVTMKHDDSFYVTPSLMSNGAIITGECKQEKTLHTGMGLVPEFVFVVVLKTTGSCLCFYVFLWKCVPSLVAALYSIALDSKRIEHMIAGVHAGLVKTCNTVIKDK